jgi:uncharacterized protein YecE (DUF72 family)
MRSKAFFIGCSGYYYPYWKNIFYPNEIATSKWLSHYSSIFNTVELNGTFYKVPQTATLRKYRNQVPEHFRFSVKVNRYITHLTKLKNSKTKIAEFTDVILSGLDTKLSNLLFQLPPSFKYSEENLATLLENIPAQKQNVIEFRDSSWFENQADKILKQHGYTFCNTDYPGLQQTFTSTSKNFYARLHGVPVLFKSSYSNEILKQFVKNLPKDGENYFIYFNNTSDGAAFRNAEVLSRLLEKK